MQRLRFHYNGMQQDIQKIILAAQHVDLHLEWAEAYLLWRCHSESHCAGWLGLPDPSDPYQPSLESILEDYKEKGITL